MAEVEKRKARRVDKKLEVKFHSVLVENTAITNNVSECGLFITTTKGFAEGCAINIKLQPPDSRTMSITGRVVRNIKDAEKKSGMAISGMAIELIDPVRDYVEYVQNLNI